MLDVAYGRDDAVYGVGVAAEEASHHLDGMVCRVRMAGVRTVLPDPVLEMDEGADRAS